MTEPTLGLSERPIEPEFRVAQRGRLLLSYVERGERHDIVDTGWIKLDGPWVHFFSDEQDIWQSWPMAHVIAVDWEQVDAPAF